MYLWPNKEHKVYVAAGVEMNLHIYMTMESELAPIDISGIELQQGEVLDLGSLEFGTPFNVAVKVVDSSGKGIEGVMVRPRHKERFWIGGGVTNSDGIAIVSVRRHSKGVFIVEYLDEESRKRYREGTPYEVGGDEDEGREFILKLSDEMLYNLFK
jgi:hypothetical protein